MEILDYKIFQLHNIDITPKVLLVIFLGFCVLQVVLYVIKRIFHRSAKNRNLDYGVNFHSIYLLIKYVVWIYYIHFILSYLGVDLTLFIAGSAALLVGIGLGLQQTFNDFVSGIIILLEGTIKVGDIVEIEDTVVKVLEIKLRTSRVVNRGDIVMIIPNHKFIVDNVVNWTHNDKMLVFRSWWE